MKKKKFLSALLAPMLCVSGSVGAHEKNKSVNSFASDTEIVKNRSNSMDVNSSSAVSKYLISGLIGAGLGAGLGAVSAGIPLTAQKSNLEEEIKTLQSDNQDYKVLKRKYDELKKENDELKLAFEYYQNFEKYFNGDRSRANKTLACLVEFLPYFMDKNGNPTGKLNFNTVFDGVETVFNNDGREFENFLLNKNTCQTSWKDCTDKAKLKLEEYGIKSLAFFAAFFDSGGQQKKASKDIIENLSLQIG